MALASTFVDGVGPLVGAAACAGLAIAAIGWRLEPRAIALPAIAIGAVVEALRDDAVVPAVLVVAAIASGVAVARLAGVARRPVAQAWLGATAAFVIGYAPAVVLAGR